MSQWLIISDLPSIYLLTYLLTYRPTCKYLSTAQPPLFWEPKKMPILTFENVSFWQFIGGNSGATAAEGIDDLWTALFLLQLIQRKWFGDWSMVWKSKGCWNRGLKFETIEILSLDYIIHIHTSISHIFFLKNMEQSLHLFLVCFKSFKLEPSCMFVCFYNVYTFSRFVCLLLCLFVSFFVCLLWETCPKLQLKRFKLPVCMLDRTPPWLLQVCGEVPLTPARWWW